MKLIRCVDYAEMSRKAAETVCECIRQTPRALVSFPGGDTPLGMVREFVRMVNDGAVDISQASYVSLDEWVGLGADTEGSCAHFNKTNLFTPLRRSFANAHLIDGAAADMEREKQSLDQFIAQHGPLSVSVLGIGLNGHLGFNEEGSGFDWNAHIVPLSPVTIDVMGKYFSEDLPLTQGITQGLGQIMQAETVLLIANGEKKAEILKRALEGEITEEIPASVLQRHPNCICIFDEAAASLLR